jgi:Tfp pilus assembly protein PilV
VLETVSWILLLALGGLAIVWLLAEVAYYRAEAAYHREQAIFWKNAWERVPMQPKCTGILSRIMDQELTAAHREADDLRIRMQAARELLDVGSVEKSVPDCSPTEHDPGKHLDAQEEPEEG